MIRVVLRSRLESSLPPMKVDERLVVVNDVRRPLGLDQMRRHHLDDADVYDLYSFVDDHKKELVKGYLDAVDRLFFDLGRLVRSRYYSDNILLYHFSSKRTDVYPTFLRYCVLSLRDRIAGQFPEQRVSFDMDISTAGFSVAGRLRLALLASLFFLKVLFIRAALGLRRQAHDLEDSEVIFYTQYPRQSGPGFDNVNYGRVFNALSPDVRCVYMLSALTDGVHDGPGWAELLSRSRAETAHERPVWIMERAIDVPMVFRIARLLVAYIWTVMALTGRRLSMLPHDYLYIFEDELRPTVRRLFNYAYVLELSKNLARVVQNKVFVYYLFEHNYGKLLSFHLHQGNVTLGCQHGTMCHLRLGQYLTTEEMRVTTFPKHIIAEGNNHKNSLEWIHPDVDVEVLGAPRVEHLAAVKERIREGRERPGRQVSVLVPLSLHGELDILDYVVETLKVGRDVHFYIKPHPAGDTRQELQIHEYFNGAGLTEDREGYLLYTDNVYDLIDRVDYVLFADTSVGLEFAQVGVTPISAEPPDRLNLSPLADLGVFRPDIPRDSFFVSSPRDLWKRLSEDTPRADRTIPEGFFFAHVGSSTEKWAEFIKSQIPVAAQVR